MAPQSSEIQIGGIADGSISTKYIKAEFEIVTPMFLGGAEHEAGRIRETSVKGALAFWWRALKYSDFVERAGEDQDKALHNMRKREIALFGGETAQGAFSLIVKQDEHDIEHDGQTNANSASTQIKSGAGTTYLATVCWTKANSSGAGLSQEKPLY